MNIWQTLIVFNGIRRFLALKLLTSHASEQYVLDFIKQLGLLESQKDKDNADAMLEVSIAANPSLYRQLEEAEKMNALNELFKDRSSFCLDGKSVN